MRAAFLGAFLMFSAGCGQAQQYGQSGEAIYAATCQTCHADDGRGVNDAFPPLVDSPWLELPDAQLIRLTFRGLQGPIVVHERTYNNVMPPHAFLSDQQVASVLSYVRSRFGTGKEISAHQVAAERLAYSEGPMWTIAELAASK